MKLLLITTTFPTPAHPRQGAFNHVLVDALRTRHDVRVIAPIPWTKSFFKASRTVEPGVQHPTFFYPPKVLRRHYHHFYWLSIRSTLKRLEREFTPDVVLGYWLHPDGAAAVRAAERYHVPAIAMSGGSDLRILPRHEGRKLAVTRVLESADRLIVFSQDLATQAERLGIPSERVNVIHRGVNRNCFFHQEQAPAREICGLPQKAVVIFWAGRFEHVKNPTLFLRAAVYWKREWGDRLRVIMAGDGPMRGVLHRLRWKFDLESNLRFVGNLTQSELAVSFNAADVTVLTSHSEGIPNVLLESIACGTPFVATNVGGVSEIATLGLDRLVPAGDETALAGAVIEQLQATLPDRRTFIPSDSAGMADQFDAVLSQVLDDTKFSAELKLSAQPALDSASVGNSGDTQNSQHSVSSRSWN